MKKKGFILAAVIVCAAVVCFFLFRPKSFVKEYEKVMGNLTSYTLQGEMELNKGEDIKSYLLEVNYKHGSEDDYYRVSLFDKNLNQEQILLRNSEGVYVITPSLNQIFKFEGEWPLNSPKPYLLQTMFEVLKDENAEVEQSKSGAHVSAPVSYPNNKNYQRQEMEFDDEAKPVQVQIYDEDNTVQLRLVFDKVQYNNELSDDVFAVPAELDTSVAAVPLAQEDLPLYPVSTFDARLVSNNVMQVNGEPRHVLEFTGEKNMTIVEKIKAAGDATTTVFMPGEMVDTLDVIGFYDGASMSAYRQNVELTLFSQDLSMEEMMSVLSSLQVAVMK